MSSRYLLGSQGVVLWQSETDAYESEVTDDGTNITNLGDFDELGFSTEDIELPNENPHTPMPTGGFDGPYVNSEDPREHTFDAGTVLVDENAPFEHVLGAEEVDESAVEYDAYIYTPSRPVPTMTVIYQQEDADLLVPDVGCKADATISWSMEDPLEVSYSITAASQDVDAIENLGTAEYTPGIETGLQPFRSEMLGTVSLSEGLTKEIATITGGEIAYTNGHEVNHHGDGREGYSVSEETNAERYDISLDYKPTDDELFEHAATNGDLVDIEIPFTRAEASGTITDGVIISLDDCTITDAPMPQASEGSLESSFSVLPSHATDAGMTIEIRRPVA